MAAQSTRSAEPMLGLEILYEPGNPEHAATVDIVAIHGLGASPEKSWVYDQEGEQSFNWLKDKCGLPTDFPDARIMLYAYASAYQGRFKMKQFIRIIAAGLLDRLQERREGCSRRPLILLGHSMGGIVIAKALCLAERQTSLYPDMYECIAGCVFFGTPFNGAPVAEIADYWAKINEKSGIAVNSQLLELLKPGNDSLRELKRDFMMTNWDDLIQKLASQEFPPDLLSKLDSKESREFVTRDSASLDGSYEVGLFKAHRDLVRFKNSKDPQYQAVKGPLKRVIQNAPLVARARLRCSRETVIDQKTLGNVLSVLRGVDIKTKYDDLSARSSEQSWILEEQEYQNWLEPNKLMGDAYLWICGSEGKGKTTAALATIHAIDSRIREAEEQGSTRRPDLLAYFFCEQTADCNTAEHMLKSILRQLCKQQEILATYAKQFARMSKEEGNKRQPQLSVENLWQCLRDMLTEGSIDTVHFVINNLHNLPENDTSTTKLLSLIGKDIQGERQEKGKRVSTKWLFTSRDREAIRECMELSSVVHCINLENEKYGRSLKLELKQHAWVRVDGLRKEKGYNKAITYFAGSVIGNRAEQSKWIDVAVVRLAALPAGANDIRIRNMLERVPQDFTALLDDAWTSILRPSTEDIGLIKELLRVLIITYEDPTERELLVLVGLSPDSEQHKKYLLLLVEKCKPLLCLKKIGKTRKITFVNADVKSHLLSNAKKLLGLSRDDIRLQHGILALRCFSHILDRLSSPPEEISGRDAKNELARTDDGKEQQSSYGQEILLTAEDSKDEDAQNSTADVPTDRESSESDDDSYGDKSDEGEQEKKTLLALRYATVYWINHASEATLDVAERLCLEVPFWSAQSKVRIQWCDEYERLTETFKSRDVGIENLTALHIASTIGFPYLVESLLSTGHEAEIHEYDSLQNQPLHLAALFGNTEIVELLLNKGARLDDAGPQGQSCTPLAMAAFSGKIDVMTKLIRKGADKDAVAASTGPVINAAILSGITEAVTLLIEMGVKLSYEEKASSEQDQDDQGLEESNDRVFLPPLALAALVSDISLLTTILEIGESSLTANEHAKALIQASFSGRIEVVEKLLDYEYEPHVFQKSLESATEENNWDVVRCLLRNCSGLDCEKLFKCASTGSEGLEDILEDCWKHTNGSLPQALLDSCLYSATDFEKQETVVTLLGFGADPNALGEEFGNALTAAANDGTIPIATALLTKGADVNSPHGFALQAAAAQGHLEMVQLLVEHGAYIDNVSDRREACTALQAACSNGLVDVAEFLLDNGADPNVSGGLFTQPIIATICQQHESSKFLCRLLRFEGLDLDVCGGPLNSTPIHYAALLLPAEDVRRLIRVGAPVNIKDANGDTALMTAARAGDRDTVDLLLENNADFTIAGSNGLTALDLAAQLGHAECVRLLAGRASKVMRELRQGADENNETALRILDLEMQSRSESMSREPKKIFEDVEELFKFYSS
ncbi:ankyrin repeat-containing domain protein [Ustulina deusta]|nr:ankyrin repeat-containing domain protein [Ustulina deusta]